MWVAGEATSGGTSARDENRINFKYELKKETVEN